MQIRGCVRKDTLIEIGIFFVGIAFFASSARAQTASEAIGGLRRGYNDFYKEVLKNPNMSPEEAAQKREQLTKDRRVEMGRVVSKATGVFKKKAGAGDRGRAAYSGDSTNPSKEAPSSIGTAGKKSRTYAPDQVIDGSNPPETLRFPGRKK